MPAKANPDKRSGSTKLRSRRAPSKMPDSERMVFLNTPVPVLTRKGLMKLKDVMSASNQGQVIARLVSAELGRRRLKV